MTAKLAYCEAEVASAAPATPHPSTNIRKQSSPKFTKFEATAAINGVLWVTRQVVNGLKAYHWFYNTPRGFAGFHAIISEAVSVI